MKYETAERMRLYALKKYQDVPMCVNCRYYYLHYIYSAKRYLPVDCGHCTEPRLKTRQPWDICQYFMPKAASAPGKAQTK